MKRLLLVVAPLLAVPGQVPPSNPAVPTSVAATLIFLGTVMFSACVAVIRTLWKDNVAQRSAIQALQTSMSEQRAELLKQSLTVTLDASNRIKESDETMEKAMTMIHQLVATRPSGEQLAEINLHLRDLKDTRGGHSR